MDVETTTGSPLPASANAAASSSSSSSSDGDEADEATAVPTERDDLHKLDDPSLIAAAEQAHQEDADAESAVTLDATRDEDPSPYSNSSVARPCIRQPF